MHCLITHHPQAVRQYIAGVPLLTDFGHRGCALQEFHYPLAPGAVALLCKSSTAHFPQLL